MLFSTFISNFSNFAFLKINWNRRLRNVANYVLHLYPPGCFEPNLADVTFSDFFAGGKNLNLAATSSLLAATYKFSTTRYIFSKKS